ncbi:glycosyltransferase family 4 protein [Brachybacterium alimentarium]|uniref:glycosyltransferase family 4 protein n=1 Tax=Brachybacterium alimentarium TaxID=47845 RepID=UPI003FD1C091
MSSMRQQRILIPARTVAEWGGLHEWVVDGAADLIAAGHDVTVVGGPGLFEQRAQEVGASYPTIDWDQWEAEVDRIADTGPYDIVFAHAPQARMLALKLPKWPGSRIHVMVHGAYHDYVYTWADQVESIAAASPCLVDFLTRIGKIEPWKIDMVPNGVSDHVFDLPMHTLEERLEDGVGRIVMASRLARDKTMQIDAAKEALAACSRLRPDVTWQLDILGDGPLRDRYEREFRRFTADNPRVQTTFHGWVAPEEVPRRMNTAVIGLVAGMGGIRTLAAGALCIGVGARGSVGVQVGSNLRAGLWTNFGDHGTPQFTPTSITSDLERVLQPGAYEEAVGFARTAARRTRSGSVVRDALLTALQCG